MQDATSDEIDLIELIEIIWGRIDTAITADCDFIFWACFKFRPVVPY